MILRNNGFTRENETIFMESEVMDLLGESVSYQPILENIESIKKLIESGEPAQLSEEGTADIEESVRQYVSDIEETVKKIATNANDKVAKARAKTLLGFGLGILGAVLSAVPALMAVVVGALFLLLSAFKFVEATMAYEEADSDLKDIISYKRKLERQLSRTKDEASKRKIEDLIIFIESIERDRSEAINYRNAQASGTVVVVQ
jgi:hypothetical protein